MVRRPAAPVTLVLAALVAACGTGGNATPSPTVAPSATSSAATASAVASPSSAPSSAAPSGTSSGKDLTGLKIALEPVATGFDRPLFVTHAGDGSGRLFVVEQGGRIWAVTDGQRAPSPFLDISDEISSGGERGLLGLAFHPRFPDDPRVFVDYTNAAGDTVVASFQPGLDADALDPASERQIIMIKQPYANHNGGALAFDAEGKLLIGMGDGGSGGDPQNRAENGQELLGKILRLDVDAGGTAPYGIPADNPFVDGPDRPEIGFIGLRNPWRLSIDRATGDLWIGDVGQGAVEEVDVARKGQLGLDFGWSTLEGTACFKPSEGCDTSGKTMPVAEYTHHFGCTVIGGYVYRGAAHPALTGIYVYADYCSGTMWAIDAAQPGTPVVVNETGRTVGSFGEDEAGELYLADLGSGEILRLAPGA